MSKLLGGLGLGPRPSPPIIVLIEICRSLNEFKQIHAHTITNGLSHFTYITSKLLSFSALSPHGGALHHAETIFNRIPNPNIFDFNSMFTGFSKNSQPEKGLLLFTKMRRLGVEPNARTFTALVQLCVSLSLLDQVYGLVFRFGNTSDVYVTSSVISMYSKYGSVDLARCVFDESSNKNVVCWTSLLTGYCSNGLVVEARHVFDTMPERNIISCSAMISGYVKNDCFNEAVELFSELKSSNNLMFNGSLLVSVLNACAAIGAYKEGEWIHDYIDENGFEYELQLGTALIDFYAKCGCIEDACEVFNQMPCKDVMTWSAMILGLAMNGMSKKGLELFAEMEKRGPRPNAVTFVGVLTACNHKSLVPEAWRLFGQMVKVYGISPTIEHYGCMVDLLARAGLVKEAETLIKSMPMEADGAIWGSLLNGCLINGHIELAKRVGRLVVDLEPRHSGRYALLANIYATMGCWEDVIRLRKLMKTREVATVSAWSFIEIDGGVHKFLVTDKSHFHWRGIYKVLNLLRKEFEGFSAVNDLLLC